MRLVFAEHLAMIFRFDDFPGDTSGIITFCRDKYPIDVVETTQIADKECLGVGRPDNDYTRYAGFACGMHGIDKIF